MNNKNYRKEIKVNYNPKEQAFYINYLLHSETKTIQFHLRTVSSEPNWTREVLPLGIEIHSDVKRNDEDVPYPCGIRPSGRCYCDGTSLGGTKLWEEFIMTGNEDIIWTELEQWMGKD